MSLMYGADGLPVMLDQSWFSIRMRNTVWMGQAPLQVPGRVVNVDDPVPVHVAAADCGERGGRHRRGSSTQGGGREQEGKGKADSQKPTGREAQGVLLCPPRPNGEQGYSSHAIRHPSITDVTRPMAAQRDDFLYGPDSAGTDRA